MNELKKWSLVKDKYIEIHDFLQEMSVKGFNICTFSENTSINGGEYLPTMVSYRELVMAYLNIDEDQLEKERCELLESLQNE